MLSPLQQAGIRALDCGGSVVERTQLIKYNKYKTFLTNKCANVTKTNTLSVTVVKFKQFGQAVDISDTEDWMLLATSSVGG